MVYLAVVAWHWSYSTASNITTDQHEQTVIALVALALTVLGGMFRIGNRLGAVTQKLEDMAARMDRWERRNEERRKGRQ